MGEIPSVSLSEDGTRVETEAKLREHLKALDTGMKWAKRIKDIFDNCREDEFDDADENIKNAVAGDTVSLYLVVELTGWPLCIVGCPIPITTPK